MKVFFRGRVALVVCATLAGVSGCAVVDKIKADMAELRAESAYSSKQYSEAADAYRTAAESGSGYAQYRLSWMYTEGTGVREDAAEAQRWMDNSAESGFPAAHFALGIRSLEGKNGLQKDPKAAYLHFEKAAAKEDEIAMFYLGMLNAKGLGVQPSASEALRWFRLAKANGYPVADQLLSESKVSSFMQKDQRAELLVRPPPASTPVSVSSEDNAQKIIRSTQIELKRHGFNPGVADGMFGAKTKSAIEAYQKAHKLPVDGKPSASLLDALKSKP